jgi:1,4-alpha-glucan branching enzyme
LTTVKFRFILKTSSQEPSLHGKENLVPKKSNKQKVSFNLLAPQAQNVLLAADFTNWEQSPLSLKKMKGGLWKGSVSLPPGSYEYRFIVDGQWQDDPDCPNHRLNRFGVQNCVCKVTAPSP